MTSIEIKEAVLEMTPAERLDIIHAAWRSLSLNDQVPITAVELALIDERIGEHEANPEEGVPWEEVKAELWPDL